MLDRHAMPLMSFDGSKSFIQDASRYLAGGVSSNFRLGMRPGPLAFTRAEGPFLYDVDDNRLVDYYLGMGPMILGHNPPAVAEAVRSAPEAGLLFGGERKTVV